MDSEELWEDVFGYEDRFRISSHGRLYSKISCKILSQTISKTGYYTHGTKIGGRNGKAVCFKIHRLVAKAFLLNPEEKLYVNHKDGNKLNNLLSNLEWVTSSENSIHAHKNGFCTHPKGDMSKNSKLNQSIVEDIRREYSEEGVSQRSLASKYSVSKTTIQNILKFKRWV